MNLSRIFRALAAALLGAVFVLPAAASDFTQPRVAVVKYDDLDLTQERDAKKLYSRLRAAAREACSDFDSREMKRKAQWRACYEDSLSKAVVQINRATVTALHARATQREKSS